MAFNLEYPSNVLLKGSCKEGQAGVRVVVFVCFSFGFLVFFLLFLGGRGLLNHLLLDA